MIKKYCQHISSRVPPTLSSRGLTAGPTRIIFFLVVALLTGCVSSEYVEQKQYLMNLPKRTVSVSQNTHPTKCVLSLAPTVAVEPFDQLDFLYRHTTDQYLVDYYHGFLTLPSDQLEALFKQYFKDHGLNLACINQEASVPKLHIVLEELYADYRKHNEPCGVIAVRFLVTQKNAGKKTVLLNKSLRKCFKLSAKNTLSLLNAWNAGLESICQQALYELQHVVKSS